LADVARHVTHRLIPFDEHPVLFKKQWFRMREMTW